ncbi:hypothetical protein CONPUDRAFT_163618 [Coniophora puteana RWD-64-598 SS2]|uniref:DUF7918 domain-containing protein n=1 Tax=Coniophora puteana (strain RWD-64-598) TaxID=741705 RepID=A0A5M3MZQ9_CONPW|nr:uncharacterized protein CONPUDRAFT_163618 [Coniophora puteana RWD-64-598 SS2]EIW84516.1 hypothetical protein CONPUDRAFT_163618 [Coniophora puteana RWD-64-598 SS2]
MLELSGFNACIYMGDDEEEREEYKVRKAETKSKRQVSCWISSEAGQKFTIFLEYTGASRCNFTGEVFLDGHSYEIVSLKAPQQTRVSMRGTTVEIAGDIRWRPFMFSKLQLTDDEQYRGRYGPGDIGTILLKIYKIKYTTEAKSGPSASVNATANKVHEEDKKNAPHCISFGEADHYESDEGFHAQPYWSSQNGTPFNYKIMAKSVEFLFRYRPLDVLQANGIVPLQRPIHQSLEDRHNEFEQGSSSTPRTIDGASPAPPSHAGTERPDKPEDSPPGAPNALKQEEDDAVGHLRSPSPELEYMDLVEPRVTVPETSSEALPDVTAAGSNRITSNQEGTDRELSAQLEHLELADTFAASMAGPPSNSHVSSDRDDAQAGQAELEVSQAIPEEPLPTDHAGGGGNNPNIKVEAEHTTLPAVANGGTTSSDQDNDHPEVKREGTPVPGTSNGKRKSRSDNQSIIPRLKERKKYHEEQARLHKEQSRLHGEQARIQEEQSRIQEEQSRLCDEELSRIKRIKLENEGVHGEGTPDEPFVIQDD